MNETEIEYLLPRLKPGSTVIDVGCHKAEFAAPFLLGGYRVIGLEPNASDPELKEKLDAVNGLELFELAASDCDGVTEMFIGEHVATNTLEKKWTRVAFPQNFTTPRTKTVRVVKLMTLLNQLGVTEVALVKIDAEGHDERVLGGLLAGKVRPKFVMFEAHYKFPRDLANCHAMLAANGYRDFKFFVHRAYGSCGVYDRNFSWGEDEEFYANVICSR